ncbi:MAG: hypothetical protein RML45_07450 [Acetobacteraceae bacterium]|nr:hypothetical protein [Acetobacteraceae bacterium]
MRLLLPWLNDPRTLRLKWPNDLLLDGAKLGGILIEAGRTNDGVRAWAVAGIGVNVVSAPEDAGQPAVALATHARSLPPVEALARGIVRRLQDWSTRLATGGLAAVLPAWQRFAIEPGTALTIRMGETTLEGSYLGVDADGALLLQTSDGARRSVIAGEVL